MNNLDLYKHKKKECSFFMKIYVENNNNFLHSKVNPIN